MIQPSSPPCSKLRPTLRTELRTELCLRRRVLPGARSSGRVSRPPARLFIALFLGFVGSLVGCGGGAPELREAPYPRAFAAALRGLEDEGYAIDRANHRHGRITSKPRAASTWPEVWRGDHADLATAAQSTLHKQRRIAVVTLSPVSPAPDTQPDTRPEHQPLPTAPPASPPGLPFQVNVGVMIERENSTLRRLSGSTHRGRVFADLDANPRELELRGVPASHWRRVGHDEPGERRLRLAIARHLAQASRRDLTPGDADPARSP